jgi:mono/diheme cytochrome c family protein
MLGRAFLLASAAFLGLLAFAFWRDANRDYIPVQQKYLAKYGGSFPIGIQQLFPKVQVNGNFQVERCITCHVPDITKIGPQQAAQRLGGGHPSVIDDAVFAKYGQDTLICRTGTTVAASPSPAASGSANPSASPAASGTPKPSASPNASPPPGTAANPKTANGSLTGGSTAAAPANIGCQDPNATPFYLLDATGKQVTDSQTGKPVVAALTGFIPRQFKGLGIDESGCIICHNGNRQATSTEGAHQNLVPNPFAVYDTAPTLFQQNCAVCHGALGEGGKGPPLNDQDRLGFFNDDYYQRCIFLGNKGSEHLGTIMPAWGLTHALSNDRINTLIHWIRLWQDYAKLP